MLPAAGEMLQQAEPFLERHLHPTVIVNAYFKALEDAMIAAETCSFAIDLQNREQLGNLVRSSYAPVYHHDHI